MNDAVAEFGRVTGLCIADDGLRAVAAALRGAMAEGLARDGAELSMIPTYVPPAHPGLRGDVVALDAGGTNVRAARVHVSGAGEVAVGPAATAPLPGSRGDTHGRAAFFDRLAELVVQVGGPPAPIGFCFSYPARILPSGDGVLLRWTKEVQAPEVVGTAVGSGLADAVERRGLPRPPVVVLNDTVAAAAAGTLVAAHGPSTVGLVVGTGTNVAYFAQAASIAKIGTSPGPAVQAVNLESGNFSGVPATVFDARIDRDSADPGRQRFEKMVSGRYLGPLGGLVLHAAAGAGLVGRERLARLPAGEGLASECLAAYLAGRVADAGPLAHAGEPDPAVQAVLALVRDRAADLVAASLFAVLAMGGAGPAAVVAEGTVYHHLPGFAARVETVLGRLRGPDAAPVAVLRIAQANLLGSAAAALAFGA